MKQLMRFLLLSASVTPLLFSQGVFWGFVSSKILFFSLIVVLAGIIFFVLLLRDIDFQNDIFAKIQRYTSHPLIIVLTAFVFVSFISVIFASDGYSAFWGTIERGEGFVGMCMLYVFFALTLLTFKKKDWFLFFKISILVSLVVIAKSFFELFSGINRPVSTIGNPAFLAGYLLFSLTSSVIIAGEEKKRFWKLVSLGVFVVSVGSIFVTQTRGAILGLCVGLITVLIYFILKGRNTKIFRVSLRNLSIGILSFVLIGTLLFIFTKQNAVWKSIPGISRFSDISLEDRTTAARIMTWKTSIESVNPRVETKEFIIGWGLENSTLALNAYYNPLQHKYDSSSFDRSHNKFLDVWVMSGIFAFFAYILIWFYFFKISFTSEKEYSFVYASLIFFASSFFVHLLFVFDQVPTSIVFFFLLAFCVFLQKNDDIQYDISKTTKRSIKVITGVVVVFISFVFVRGTLVSYFQMKHYLSSIAHVSSNNLENLEKSFYPFSPAQDIIRKHFLEITTDAYDTYEQGSSEELVAREIFANAIEKGDEYIQRNSTDFRFLNYMASAFNKKFEVTKNSEDLKRSELYMRQALVFAPERQELHNNLVFNVMHQGRFEEALDIVNKNIERDPLLSSPYFYKAVVLHVMGPQYFAESLENFEKSFSLDPEEFQERNISVKVYESFLQYFYKNKDKENFIIVSERLQMNSHSMSSMLEKILEYVDRGVWPSVSFK